MGWPSIAASASMPPTPQPTTPIPLIIDGVAVGADQGVGIDDRLLADLFLVHAARQVLEIHLMNDADARRHHAEGVEGLQHNARDDEGNLVDPPGTGRPVGQLPDVLFGQFLAVAVAQHRFEHDANRNRQTRNLAHHGLFERRQRMKLAGLPGPQGEFPQGVEWIMTHLELSLMMKLLGGIRDCRRIPFTRGTTATVHRGSLPRRYRWTQSVGILFRMLVESR